jgi:glycosyltransferase involved in cell wall biosynthesis
VQRSWALVLTVAGIRGASAGRVLLAFEPPDGGVADSVLYLARGLGSHGWKAEVAGPPGSLVQAAIEAAGVRYHAIALSRGYARPDRDLEGLLALRALLREGRFDVAHLHSSKAGFLGRLASVAARTPWIYSPHCFSFVGPVGRVRSTFGMVVELALGRIGGGMIVAVADAERREALSHRLAPPERVALIRNGCPPCPARLEPDAALAQFADGHPTAGTLCVLRRQKGVANFLRAAGAILTVIPDARLAVVGDGPERHALETRARGLGLDGRVRFFAYRGPAARQLASLDVFVLPSLWEAFPLSLLEALACGVPQVATDVGGTSEAVVDGVTGLLVPPGDVGSLADAVTTLLRDPVRRAGMSTASRARHTQRFSVDAMIGATAAVYDAVVAARSAPNSRADAAAGANFRWAHARAASLVRRRRSGSRT